MTNKIGKNSTQGVPRQDDPPKKSGATSGASSTPLSDDFAQIRGKMLKYRAKAGSSVTIDKPGSSRTRGINVELLKKNADSIAGVDKWRSPAEILGRAFVIDPQVTPKGATPSPEAEKVCTEFFAKKAQEAIPERAPPKSGEP